jgi:hypothetical protein
MIAAIFRPVLGFGLALLLVISLAEWIVVTIQREQDAKDGN